MLKSNTKIKDRFGFYTEDAFFEIKSIEEKRSLFKKKQPDCCSICCCIVLKTKLKKLKQIRIDIEKIIKSFDIVAYSQKTNTIKILFLDTEATIAQDLIDKIKTKLKEHNIFIKYLH